MAVSLDIWKERKLVEPIKEVLFAPDIHSLTRRIAKESSVPKYEDAGYFSGLVVDGSFLLFDHQPLGMGNNFGVAIKPLLPYQARDQKRFHERFPNYRSVLYHTHPKLTVDNLSEVILDPEPALEMIKRHIEAGVFDYLQLSRDDPELITCALNETFSRELSLADKKNTPGNYHLLITHTYSMGDPNSHLNFYELQSSSLADRRVPVRLAKENLFTEISSIEKELHDLTLLLELGTKDIESMSQDDRTNFMLKTQGMIDYHYINGERTEIISLRS